ncbi:MAG: hypothetical protein MUF23_17080, partial [Pirellula sp.]|nr:hypothetical protein [Pirellula sp.]
MRQSIAKMADGWGVGQMEIPVGQIAPDATVRVVVRERDDRVLYPATEIFSADPGPATPIPGQPMPGQRTNGRAIGGGALVKRLRGALDRLRQHIDPEEYVRIHFLFTGNEPLHIELEGDLEMSMVLDPNQLETSASQEHMLQAWWQGYVQQTQRQIERSDYPTLIERYLVHMLGRRFGFQTPDLLNVKSKKRVRQTDPRPTLSLLAGVESLRDEISEQLWIEPLAPSAPRQQLPSPPRWLDHPVPDIPDDISIESIAQVVPEDFFYIRFGSFANFLWFQRIGESRGGDIAQLAMLRGFNYESSARVERVLNTRMTAVSKLFGDSVISDMAIVGYDLYMQEGPSMGIIFEARNFGVLKASMEQERQATLRRLESAGCRLEAVDIDGRTVSLLSTPDHQIRSYMVEAEPYLFLTTSKTLASRFLEVQESKASLSNNLAFRFARWMMPLENRYDMFAYFSSEFFHNLLSPRYQIELQRRMLAIAAIETVELAAMVDASEQRRGFAGRNLQGRSISVSSQAEELRVPQSASMDIDRWIAKGYLPEWFQRRADGSETLRYADGWIDSARGKRGCFLPIADTPVDDCSTEEAAAYEMTSEFYANQWQETDPLMFGLRRFAHPELPKAERLAIEAYVA